MPEVVFTLEKMSQDSELPQPDDLRYRITLASFKEESCVFYQIHIGDRVTRRVSNLTMRFSQIRKIHDKIVDSMRSKRDLVP
jgi:hypothetical protein